MLLLFCVKFSTVSFYIYLNKTCIWYKHRNKSFYTTYKGVYGLCVLCIPILNARLCGGFFLMRSRFYTLLYNIHSKIIMLYIKKKLYIEASCICIFIYIYESPFVYTF